MHWSDIPFRPPLSTLRQFAALWLLIFSGLACWQFVQERLVLASIFLGLALTVGPTGILYPRVCRPILVGMMVIAFPLNWLLSHVLLGLVYYCLFTPLALCFRLVGRDVLGRRFRPEQATYWTDKPSADSMRSYFRQS